MTDYNQDVPSFDHKWPDDIEAMLANFQTIRSKFIGASEPTIDATEDDGTLIPGGGALASMQWWADTSARILKLRSTGNDGWWNTINLDYAMVDQHNRPETFLSDLQRKASIVRSQEIFPKAVSSTYIKVGYTIHDPITINPGWIETENLLVQGVFKADTITCRILNVTEYATIEAMQVDRNTKLFGLLDVHGAVTARSTVDIAGNLFVHSDIKSDYSNSKAYFYDVYVSSRIRNSLAIETDLTVGRNARVANTLTSNNVRAYYSIIGGSVTGTYGTFTENLRARKVFYCEQQIGSEAEKVPLMYVDYIGDPDDRADEIWTSTIDAFDVNCNTTNAKRVYVDNLQCFWTITAKDIVASGNVSAVNIGASGIITTVDLASSGTIYAQNITATNIITSNISAVGGTFSVELRAKTFYCDQQIGSPTEKVPVLYVDTIGSYSNRVNSLWVTNLSINSLTASTVTCDNLVANQNIYCNQLGATNDMVHRAYVSNIGDSSHRVSDLWVNNFNTVNVNCTNVNASNDIVGGSVTGGYATFTQNLRVHKVIYCSQQIGIDIEKVPLMYVDYIGDPDDRVDEIWTSTIDAFDVNSDRVTTKRVNADNLQCFWTITAKDIVASGNVSAVNIGASGSVDCNTMAIAGDLFVSGSIYCDDSVIHPLPPERSKEIPATSGKNYSDRYIRSIDKDFMSNTRKESWHKKVTQIGSSYKIDSGKSAVDRAYSVVFMKKGSYCVAANLTCAVGSSVAKGQYGIEVVVKNTDIEKSYVSGAFEYSNTTFPISLDQYGLESAFICGSERGSVFFDVREDSYVLVKIRAVRTKEVNVFHVLLGYSVEITEN